MVPDEPISVPDGVNEPKWIANYDLRFKGPISARQALAESRNAAAIWIGSQIGIDSILSTARRLGVSTPLHRYPTTALGASETNLLELANAYRTMASGVFAQPYVIRRVVHGGVVAKDDIVLPPFVRMDAALLPIQEGLRGVVRMPGGTAHALDSSAFPIAVMGKTGTTNDFRDALFVGSTYGIKGITVAVRIGFDDNRSLGSGETGARLALPVFREVMMAVYRDSSRDQSRAFRRRWKRALRPTCKGHCQVKSSAAVPLCVERVRPLPRRSTWRTRASAEGADGWREADVVQR